MKTLKLSASRPQDVRRAAALLKKGRLVAFATETVYGLGADALDARAALGIFRAKKRPTFDPLIVHVSSMKQFEAVTKNVPSLAMKLAARFWPGGLTLVVPKADRVPDVVTAGLSTVAVRMPAHPCANALLAAFGGPVAAPSANRFGYTSPTKAQDVLDDLDGAIDAVLDGGSCGIGIESTIVWPTATEIVLLRHGAVTVEQLSKIAKVRVRNHRPGEVLSPGGLPTHYAPRTPMALLPADVTGELNRFGRMALGRRLKLGVLLFKERPIRSPHVKAVWVLSRKGKPEEAAANLFHAIRNLDKMSLDAILAAPVPAKGIGLAIADRLEKAASGLRAGNAFYETLLHKKA